MTQSNTATGTPALVLASGGMDSAVLLATAMANPAIEVKALLFARYGQPTEVKEHECVTRWAARFSLPLHAPALPAVHAQLQAATIEADMFLPWRNLNLVAAAASIAARHACELLLYGAQAGDEEGYPDCRAEFVQALNQVLALGARKPLQLQAPFLQLDKAAIIRHGLALGVDFAETWSSYYSSTDPRPHANDVSSQVRAAAFQAIGIADPLVQQWEDAHSNA